MELLEAKHKVEFGLMCLLGHAAAAYTLVTPEVWAEPCTTGDSPHMEPPPAVCYWCKRLTCPSDVLATVTDQELYDIVTRIQHFERLRVGYPVRVSDLKPGIVLQL